MHADKWLHGEDGSRIANLARHLLHGDFRNLSPREQRVISAIARRRPTAPQANLASQETVGLGQVLADRVASFGGSWAFITIFLTGLATWILMNLLLTSQLGRTFDPYPFILLNLVLSMVSALQAPLILMSQNRQANRDRLAASLDYEINLKSELEIMLLHEKIDRLLASCDGAGLLKSEEPSGTEPAR